MFSNVITRSNRKQKRDTYRNLDKKKANTIDNIDFLVDTLLGKINHASSSKRNAVKTILEIRQRLSTKKLLSITLSFLLIFAVIASASSLVELNNQSTDILGISVDDSPLYNSTFQNNESFNISLTNNTVVDNSLTNDTLMDNSSSEFETNESIPPSDDNIVNESLNQTVTYSGLNLTLYVDKDVFVRNETVFINGIVLYNNSTINTTVELSIVGSNFNSSLSLNVFEGIFNFEFIPEVDGRLIVRGLVIYFNETDEDEIVIHVLNTTDDNLTLYVSELLIWDETDYQMKYVGDQITFYANYSNTNICIVNASCLISFNIGTWTTPELMNFNDGVYMYNRSFDIVGSFDYQVWCSAIGFENKTSSDNFVVSEDISVSTEVSIVNPIEKEFVYAVPGTSFYVERNINGPQDVSAIFAPLFSDGLNIESIEIIKHDDSGSKIVEIMRDNRPNEFIAGKSDSAIEKKIDNLRDRLPPKLKLLNHISYSDSFNFDGPVTVRIWFKAPSWEEINTGHAPSSGQISYLIFTDNSYDFESSTWWNSNWGKRKLITINSSQVDTDLTNFPILVYNSSDSDLATYAQTDGDDIAFVLYSDNTTKLNHELENYTASGQIIAWVNVTSLSSSSDTKIWMYYNNSACSNQENVIGTWDSNYMGVWHLAETPSGALDITDSTWAHNGTSQNMESTDQVAGEVNGCLLFDGSAEYVLIPDSSDWTLSNDLDWTMEGWFNFSTLPGGGDWDSMIGTPSDPYSFEFNEDGGDTTLNWWDGTSDHESSGQSSITTNEFHYGVLALNFGVASGSQWYLDGTSLGTFTAENRNVNPTGLTISGDGDPNYFTGHIDELRFSNTLRNASWITSSYNTVNNRSTTFLSFGTEETSNKPTQSGESPTNGSTEVSVTPALYVVCSDDDAGDTLNATWWSNSSGSWVQFASNETSFANGINITQTNNNFSDYNKTYYWSVNLTDGEGGWNNETYHFTTENISTSVNTISPYTITLSPLTITATGPSDLDNITLWYRWSNDNSSWDGGINDETKNTVDTNITDVDSSSDKGVETDFNNAQSTTIDGNNMTISEENTGPSGADEYQYVDGLDDTWLEWQTENGATPYLDATDDGNWIHEDNSASRQEGWFNFSDTSETGTGFNITFDFYCYGNDNDDGWDIYYEYTGDSTPEGSISFTCTQTGSYAWLSSSELTGLTATQINNMRIYLDTWNGAGGDDRWVDACRMHITRTAYDNYEMDLEYNWTTADYNGTIEEVCIYVDYHTGS
ncbi:MAG: DUF2341 domain-containing protein, partial [Thermoplasmatales archaeon]